MNDNAPLKGYIVQDESGVLYLVPAGQPSEESREEMMDYIRKNKVLQTVYANPGEDWVDLSERVRILAEAWKERLRKATTMVAN